jgi:hypothetical protein
MNGGMKRIAVVVFTAGLALLAAACGGSSGSHLAQLGSTATGSNTASSPASQAGGALAFARCMRSNGVQNFPDPDSHGGFPSSTKQIARTNPRYQAAHGACRHLLPAGNGPTSAEVQQVMNGMANFARCIRSHGVPNWPDPSLDVGRPTFDLHSLDYEAPRISGAIHDCQHLMPGSTVPRMCSGLLARQNGDPAGDERCFGGS